MQYMYTVFFNPVAYNVCLDPWSKNYSTDRKNFGSSLI
jgi:hypothetical protein